ncbi:hypothetical protein ZIOFF_034630 [Zingiber officinale]|uniref:RRM domain-containing protein n=1 Tax=Zingiber officinale TaxID=94328 RepID=A0A8J5L2M2_ZINOF|nr:hypothetical protein ZIOFF_034630 [Zingiber officinale]
MAKGRLRRWEIGDSLEARRRSGDDGRKGAKQLARQRRGPAAPRCSRSPNPFPIARPNSAPFFFSVISRSRRSHFCREDFDGDGIVFDFELQPCVVVPILLSRNHLFPTPVPSPERRPCGSAALRALAPDSHRGTCVPCSDPGCYRDVFASSISAGAMMVMYDSTSEIFLVFCFDCLDLLLLAQQLFQRDAQTITPEALESVKAALASSEVEHKSETKKKAIPRKAAGQRWEDPTLTDWPENDFRLFCGDLGNEVNDDVLSKAFSRFPTFNMARVIRDKRTGKTKGYGFVSFSNPSDLAAALKEMNGKYVGNRPIKLRKSTWKERTDVGALGRQKNHIQKKPKLPKKGVLHK